VSTQTEPHPKAKKKSTKDLLHSRMALAMMFFVNGVIFANWASRIPAVQDRIGLTERTLGLALLGVSVGVVLALPLAGGLIARYSSRTITTLGGLGFVAVLPFLGFANSFWGLWATLFVFGVSTSLMDVSMNAQAVEVEQRHDKPIMSSFHAAFSIGFAVGGGMGAAFAGLGVVPLIHFAIVSSVLFIIALVASRKLVDVPGEQGTDSPAFTLPPRSLWLLGVVAFCAAIGEGAMADWSVLYLEQIVGVGAGLAGLGLTAFSLMMTVGRLAGDSLTARFDPVGVVRLGGGLAAGGMGLALLVPSYIAAMSGFALVGLGIATVIPLAFSSAGRREGLSSGRGIAGVATIAYSGFLAGPPVIGLLAEATSLRLALGVVLALFVLMAATAGAVRRPA